ncbi:MAG: GAF domain-containing protein [Methanomicrobiaceae archaeon]|nr:GAF domain-containing protein [Methanomicrobiaceae archaeon]
MSDIISQELKKLSVLNKVITTANQAKNLDSLFRSILDSIISLLDYDAGAIYIIDTKTDTASVVDSVNVPEILLEKTGHVRIDRPPYNTIFLKGLPVITNHYEEFSPEYAKATGFSSILSVPLVSKGRVVGALNALSKKRYEVSDYEKEILFSVGEELGSTYERFAAEEELNKNAENLEVLFNSVGDMLFILDLEGRIIRVNDAVIKTLGYSEEEIKEEIIISLHPEERRNEALINLEELAAGKIDFHSIPLVAKDKRLIEAETKVTHGWWNNREVLIGVARDVTGQKVAEDRVRLYLSRVKSLLDLYENTSKSKDEIMSHTLESSCSMTESKYAFIGLIPPGESDMIMHKWSKDVMGQCRVQGQPLHLTLKTAGIWAESVRRRETVVVNDYSSSSDPAKKGCPKGHVKINRFVSVPIFDAEKIVAVLVAANKEQDYHEDDAKALMTLGNLMWEIIKNKEIENGLKREKELFMRTFESLQDAALILDAEPEYITGVNEAAVSLFGYSRRDLIGHSREILHVDAKSLENFREHIAPYIKNKKKIPRFEFRLKKSDGTIFPTEHSITPLYDSDGSLSGWVSIVRDITEKKEYEMREKAALIQIEENLEQLATLNDQIRNPLAVITGLADLYCPETSEKIIDQVNEINGMIRMLDAGWVRSEKIWAFLRSHYRIGEEGMDSEKNAGEKE